MQAAERPTPGSRNGRAARSGSGRRTRPSLFRKTFAETRCSSDPAEKLRKAAFVAQKLYSSSHQTLKISGETYDRELSSLLSKIVAVRNQKPAFLQIEGRRRTDIAVTRSRLQ